MSNTKFKAKVKRQKAKGWARRWRSASSRLLFIFCLLPFAFLLAACRQDMQDQPRYEPYESTTFYKDGQSSRPLVENTVPRGERFLREDEYFWTGKISSGQGVGGQSVPSDAGSTGGVATGTGTQSGGGGQMTGDVNVRGNTAGGMPGGAGNASSPPGVGGGGSDVQSGPDVFPIQITEEVLLRGQERFNAYCSMCHGATGLGDGMVVRRGFRRPPSLHEDRLQTGDASAAHYFNVITNGWGSMPAYADLVPVEDRWRIIAYIRALQLSQRATLDDVPADQRAPLANGATAEPHGGGPQD